MKDYATLMVRHGAPVIRNPKGKKQRTTGKQTKSPRSLHELAHERGSSTGDKVANPNSVKSIPDSWVAPAPKRPFQNEPEIKRKPGPKKMARHKTRRTAMSISVSEEEEFMLRTHAAKEGLSFSEWARTVMFQSMGRKPPPRKD